MLQLDQNSPDIWGPGITKTPKIEQLNTNELWSRPSLEFARAGRGFMN